MRVILYAPLNGWPIPRRLWYLGGHWRGRIFTHDGGREQNRWVGRYQTAHQKYRQTWPCKVAPECVTHNYI